MVIGLLGLGTIGSGVVEVLDMNKESIAAKLSEEVAVKYILDIREFKDDPFAHLITNDFEKILNDEEVAVVAEVMGGVKPAYDFTKKLLEKGKHVVTSNKSAQSVMIINMCLMPKIYPQICISVPI